MPRIGALLVLMLGVLPAGPASAQTEVQTTWNCKDASGRTTLTNVKAATIGKECKIVTQERVTVVPAPAPAKSSAKSPGGFPKESASDRVASRAKQKETIEKELGQEESMLADARKKLAEQEAIRSGSESNYAKVLERLRPFQDTVEVHEKNVEALKRELVNLSR